MNVLGQSERPAGALALPVALTALLATLWLAPGCIIYDGDGGDAWGWDGCDVCSAEGEGEIVDSDGDGIPDDAEAACNLDPNNADTDGDGVLDGDEDLDGDGATTAEEIAFGSNCADGNDFPGSAGEGEGEGEG